MLFGLLITGVYFFAQPLYDKLNLGLLSHKTIMTMIEGSIDWDLLSSSKVPIFITVAKKYEMPQEPIIKHRYVSDYLRLNSITKDLAMKIVSASMALPFGLFSQIKIGNDSYVDGGLGDNTPVYPLLFEGCDKIYVVHLKSGPKEKGCQLTDPDDLHTRILMIDNDRANVGLYSPYTVKETERVLELIRHAKLVGMPVEASETEIERILRRLPAEIAHIVPSSPLGFPIFGTLFFSRKKSEKLIEQGYEDAKAILRKEGYDIGKKNGVGKTK